MVLAAFQRHEPCDPVVPLELMLKHQPLEVDSTEVQSEQRLVRQLSQQGKAALQLLVQMQL